MFFKNDYAKFYRLAPYINFVCNKKFKIKNRVKNFIIGNTEKNKIKSAIKL